MCSPRTKPTSRMMETLQIYLGTYSNKRKKIQFTNELIMWFVNSGHAHIDDNRIDQLRFGERDFYSS